MGFMDKKGFGDKPFSVLKKLLEKAFPQERPAPLSKGVARPSAANEALGTSSNGEQPPVTPVTPLLPFTPSKSGSLAVQSPKALTRPPVSAGLNRPFEGLSQKLASIEKGEGSAATPVSEQPAGVSGTEPSTLSGKDETRVRPPIRPRISVIASSPPAPTQNGNRKKQKKGKSTGSADSPLRKKTAEVEPQASQAPKKEKATPRSSPNPLLTNRGLASRPKASNPRASARSAQAKAKAKPESEAAFVGPRPVEVTPDPPPVIRPDLISADKLIFGPPPSVLQKQEESKGDASRLVGIRRRKEGRDIAIGLDFGTSSTKMCWCFRSGESADHSYPIRHSQAHETYPDYCLPSVAAIANGRLLFGYEAVQHLEMEPWNSGLRNIKFLAACEGDSRSPGTEGRFCDHETRSLYDEYLIREGINPATLPPSRLAMLYLAYAMKMARAAVARQRPGSTDRLFFLIGMPIDFIEAPSVLQLFQQVYATAERLDALWVQGDLEIGPLLSRAGEARYDPAGTEGMDLCRRKDPEAMVIGVPDSVAQVLSYVRSLGSEEGLHAVVDIGAGTTDVSVFLLSRGAVDAEDPLLLPLKTATEANIRQYWLAGAHVPVGAWHLERALSKASSNDNATEHRFSNTRHSLSLKDGRCPLRIRLSRVHKEAKKWSSYSCFEQSQKRPPPVQEFWTWWAERQWLSDYARQSGMQAIMLQQCRAWEQASLAFMRAYRKKREQVSFEKLRLYVCGGGSLLPGHSVYCIPWVNTIDTVWESRQIHAPSVAPKFNSEDIPFLRMSLAYGLSLDPTIFWGEFRLPSSVGDLTSRVRSVAPSYGANDQEEGNLDNYREHLAERGQVLG